MAQGYAFLELMGIPDELHTDRNAQSIYMLLKHEKISLRENCIRSKYMALFRGSVSRIRLPFYSIFYKTNEKARKRFYDEKVIQILWARFIREQKTFSDALQNIEELRGEFLRAVKFYEEAEAL